MPARKWSLIAVSLLLLGTAADAGKILVIFPIPAKSHQVAYQGFIEELAKRGHQITVVTSYPRMSPLANYTEVIYQDTFPPRDSSNMNFFQRNQMNPFRELFFIHSLLSGSCSRLLRQPAVQNLIRSNDLEFDIVIYETFFSECIYGFLHKFKAPSIKILPNTIVTWLSGAMGNPPTISYVPDIMSNTNDMKFGDRLFGLLSLTFLRLIRKFYFLPKMGVIMREHFSDPSLPGFDEVDRSASFLFLNSHPIHNYPRPLTPNTIEVGGLHIKGPRKLPEDLRRFLDEAPQGVVYFSLGSTVRGVDMPDGMRSAILRAFSKLKQKVLWKWEADSMPGQPQNVRLGKWLPQHDILAHPNVKLFITHGGLLSMQEATYFGVPLIVIPVMGDQHFNAIRAQNNGQAVFLNVHNITEESLGWAIQEVLQEKRYRARAQQLSRQFRDQPQTPMERAVFWTEFALRHQGAAHLRSAALDLSFCEYYLLDVIAVLALAAFASLLVLAWLGRALLKCLCSKSTSKKNDSTRKKTN